MTFLATFLENSGTFGHGYVKLGLVGLKNDFFFGLEVCTWLGLFAGNILFCGNLSLFFKHEVHNALWFGINTEFLLGALATSVFLSIYQIY